MSEAKITKEQLDSIMKSNPDFAKRVLSGNNIKDSTNPTRIFTTYDDAKAALGLAEFNLVKPFETGEKEEDSIITIPENCFEFGSGVIQPDGDLKSYFENLIGKSMVSIALTGKSISVRKNIIRMDSLQEEIEYDKSIFPIRYCIVNKDEKGFFHTVSHIDASNMPVIGRYQAAKLKVVNDEKKDDPNTNFTLLIMSDNDKGRTYFRLDHNIKDLFVFPIVISKESINTTIAHLNDYWDSKKETFIDLLVEGYSEEDKTKLVPYLSELVNNPNFSKGLAAYAFENKLVNRIEDAIEANTKNVDYLNISAAMFPRYGDEYVDLEKEKVVVDEKTNLPIITDQDINNLKIVGLKKDFISQIIQAGMNAYGIAKTELDSDTEELRKELTCKSYDAECRMIVDLDTERWSESLDKDFESVADLFNHNKAIVSAKRHIESVKQQLASLQITSRRIAKKIEGGEFSNMYMQLCNTYLVGLWYKTFGYTEKKDDFNNSPWVYFIQLINLRNSEQKDHVTERIKNSLVNTVKVNVKRDKHGNVPVSLFDQAERFVDSLFDSDAIAKNTPENEIDKKIMDLVFTRFNFIDSLSRTPYKFAARIYPEVFNLDPKVNLEDAKKASEEYINSLGLKLELVDVVKTDHIASKLTEIKSAVENKVLNIDWSALRDNLNKLATVFNTVKCKNNYDKAKLFAKYFIILNAYEYADTLATGFAKFNDTIEEAKKAENCAENYLIEYDEKRYTIDEFEKFTNGKDVTGFVVLKKITDVERTNIILDWILRSAMLSLFIQSATWCEGAYTDYCRDTVKDSRSKITEEYGKMFISEIGLFVPCISVLETGGDKTISELVPNDMKIKLGTNAVDDALKTLDDKTRLTSSRYQYLVESLKMIDIALDGILQYIRS